MNEKQMQAARDAMIEWLEHPHELGAAPAEIECAGTFELHDMTYYLFRYKREAGGKWLLGVCGGYEGGELGHSGHVYSEMEEYDESTAVEKATAMVELIRTYWMEQAKLAEERKEKAGAFVGFVLLSEDEWDKEQLIRDLKEEWDIDATEEADDEAGDDSLAFNVGDMIAVASIMHCPVPDGEAEANAENNYMWPEAVNVAKAHKAQITVAVLGKDASLVERAELYVKLAACCCRQKRATGIYTSGTVFEPSFFYKFADMMKDGEFPIFNLIWFGLYRSERGVCGYTYGMECFGKDEMEVLDADAEPSDVQGFLSSMAAYVIEYDVTLNDGETIGFSAEDKHAITRSEGAALPGMTLKIEY